ncbi:MAG: hypothetical protein LBR65_06370 [Culturomica sp.]|jgi:hypothetical protein|nr:hypothetical protein [Culturomica sp.]
MKPVVISMLLLSCLTESRGQGNGGGVYLEDDAVCIGCVIRDNKALDGFGVAGAAGHLINSTIVQNEILPVDTVEFQPGDIYCGDGKIRDTAAYRKRDTMDAIGIVYWSRFDATFPYPRGAVVALEEFQSEWGQDIFVGENSQIGYSAKGIDPALAMVMDTACYTKTRYIYEEIKALGGDPLSYAASACHLYHHPAETATAALPNSRKVQWCLPTYVYFVRIWTLLPVVEATLSFLKEMHGDEGAQLFWEDKFPGQPYWYWTVNDGIGAQARNRVFLFSLLGEQADFVNTLASAKNKINYYRPIFIF